MFHHIRYQTGELEQIAAEMKKGGIPSMDVDDMEEFEAFAARLESAGIYRLMSLPIDRNARDRIKEPDFEFRAAFSSSPGTASGSFIMHIDVYFEPVPDETYDSVDEI